MNYIYGNTRRSRRSTTETKSNYDDYQYVDSEHTNRYTTYDNGFNNITGDRKQITYNDLTAIINASYGNNPDMECSTALDIIALFLHGQKILYMDAKSYSEQYLNMLMIPAIIISVIVGLMTLILSSTLGYIIIASLSALNSLLLMLISYLKLDAKSEAHRTTAYQFEKLETSCSFLSGRILFFEAESDNIADIIMRVENKINEIKEVNQFVLPDFVIRRYPTTYNTNVFSIVKKLYIDEVILKNKLMNTINKIIIKSNYKHHSKELTDEIKALEIVQDQQLHDILVFKKKYLELDKPLKYEVEKNNRINRTRFLCCCGFLNKITFGLANWCVMTRGPKRPNIYSPEHNDPYDNV